MLKKEKNIKIKNSDYQPSKAELNEPVKLRPKGRTVEQKMDDLAKAMFSGADIRHEQRVK